MTKFKKLRINKNNCALFTVDYLNFVNFDQFIYHMGRPKKNPHQAQAYGQKSPEPGKYAGHCGRSRSAYGRFCLSASLDCAALMVLKKWNCRLWKTSAFMSSITKTRQNFWLQLYPCQCRAKPQPCALIFCLRFCAAITSIRFMTNRL